ncbi:hypothetical protein [uncultured Methylobacterium sp.]|uniref:hypothetical protein n=1 Tax=uncultured Methylobacterium sp. TaxID=157278 RepID=UPI0035CC205B
MVETDLGRHLGSEPALQLGLRQVRLPPDRRDLLPVARRRVAEIAPVHVIDRHALFGDALGRLPVRVHDGLAVWADDRLEFGIVADPGRAAGADQEVVAHKAEAGVEVRVLEGHVQRALHQLGGDAPDRIGVLEPPRDARLRQARVDRGLKRGDVRPEQRHAPLLRAGAALLGVDVPDLLDPRLPRTEGAVIPGDDVQPVLDGLVGLALGRLVGRGVGHVRRPAARLRPA